MIRRWRNRKLRRLVQRGDLLNAQRIILRRLQREFGG